MCLFFKCNNFAVKAILFYTIQHFPDYRKINLWLFYSGVKYLGGKRSLEIWYRKMYNQTDMEINGEIKCLDPWSVGWLIWATPQCVCSASE